MMTRKHYREIADVLAGERASMRDYPDAVRAIDNLTCSLAQVMKRDNPRFDYGRFYAAAGREGVN